MIQLIKIKEKWFNENVKSTSVVNNEDLELFQKRNNVIIPIDLINYFKFLNGTGGDYSDNLFEFYSLDRIKKVKEEFKDLNSDYQRILKIDEFNGLYAFANYQFNLFVYAIRLYKEYSSKNEVYVICDDDYIVIANSFFEFLNLYLLDSSKLYFG